MGRGTYIVNKRLFFALFFIISLFLLADSHIFGTMSFKIKFVLFYTCDLYLYNKYHTYIVNNYYIGATIVNTYIVTLPF